MRVHWGLFMKIVEATLDTVAAANPPRLSIAVSNSGGEIKVSVSTDRGDDGKTLDFVGRPSSPTYNMQNKATALAVSIAVDDDTHCIITVALQNTSTANAVGQVEIAGFSGDKTKALVPIVDEANIALAPGASWLAHVLIKMV